MTYIDCSHNKIKELPPLMYKYNKIMRCYDKQELYEKGSYNYISKWYTKRKNIKKENIKYNLMSLNIIHNDLHKIIINYIWL